MQVIVNIFPSNLLQPMVSSDMLPVIVTAIFLGAGVLAAGERARRSRSSSTAAKKSS